MPVARSYLPTWYVVGMVPPPEPLKQLISGTKGFDNLTYLGGWC